MTPYLIQRGEIVDREYKEGIDSIISFDYMGSSEFEWGALPESLKRIRAKIDTYDYLSMYVGDKIITVFCNFKGKVSATVQEIATYLRKLANDDFRLKELSYFPEYIKGIDEFKPINFWWDIDNDIMWWGKDIEFEDKFDKII